MSGLRLLRSLQQIHSSLVLRRITAGLQVCFLTSAAALCQGCIHRPEAVTRSDRTEPTASSTSASLGSQTPTESADVGHAADRKFRIALDIGHTPHAPGAIGADGTKEYDFNQRIVDLLARELNKESNLQIIVINKDGHEISLERRSMLANAANADAFLAIHHDSANDRYLEAVKVDGKVYHQTKRFHGYSVFFSKKNPKFEDSQRFALALAKAMHQAGFTPTLHHAEPIPGENRELVDRELGVYRFDDLVVLKRSNMPSALLECGVIVNPDEERELEQTDRQMKIVQAVKTAILEFAQSAETSHSTPATAPSR